MQEFILILAQLTAGISLSIGAISFYLGWKLENKANLTFGIMALCLFTFVLLPPSGFIHNNVATPPGDLIVKRIFIYGYYAVFPWFIFWYTGQQKKRIPYLITTYIFGCYWWMVFATSTLSHLLVTIPPLLGFASIIVYGFSAGLKEHTHNKRKAKWLLATIIIFMLLVILNSINLLQFSLPFRIISPEFNLSIHLHALPFVIAMGMQLIDEILDKQRLEIKLQQHEKRWQTLMQHAPLFIMELDRQGSIIYLNQFAIKLLGHSSSRELTGRNWFDMMLSESDARACKKSFLEMAGNQDDYPYLLNTIKNKKGDTLMITWTHFLTDAEDGAADGMICLGIDTTNDQNSRKLIDQLKLELEKEKIVFPETDEAPQEIIGKSEAIRYAIEKAKQVARTHAPVLLEGETGVGKELFADLIHKISSRANAPLIKVNCGALPKELIEDELFGHEKGAFTSAIQARKGRFEQADGGTIFLDEIGELPLDMQPKLLRVLQNGEFERVGSQKTIKVDVRIIAATNRDLQQEVTQGRFRDDLFYRLNVFPITIPALRKRSGDLPLLINHFIRLESQKYNKQPDQISKADMQRLMEYSWPGNVRELKNIIERSVIASEGNTLKLDWFLSKVPDESGVVAENTLEQIERQHIIKVMESCHWKINGENGAAEKLDMHPNTLRSKMKKLGITRPVKDIS